MGTLSPIVGSDLGFERDRADARWLLLHRAWQHIAAEE